MSKLQVNSLVNNADDGPIELLKGLIVDSGTLLVQSHVNLSGVATAVSWYANGPDLSNVGAASTAKVIAMNIILGYDEYRA